MSKLFPKVTKGSGGISKVHATDSAVTVTFDQGQLYGVAVKFAKASGESVVERSETELLQLG